MSFELPIELWYQIFSYLAVEDLCKARRVCKFWWDVINRDSIWMPKLLRRNITQDCVVEKTESDARSQVLTNCQWANICHRYHRAVSSNWGLLQYQRTECTSSAEYVVIHMPYMVMTFDPYCVVEVQRVCHGKFVHWARFPLPKDSEEGCFEPHMTSDDAFAVTKNGYMIIHKSQAETFHFKISLAFSKDLSVMSCCNVSSMAAFVRGSYEHFQGFMVCLAVFKDIVWLYESFLQVVVVYDYLKRETKLRLNLRSDVQLCPQVTLKVHTAPQDVYLTRSGEVTVFSPYGQKKWTYHKIDASPLSFCSTAYGCAFIVKKFSGSKAIYIDTASTIRTYLQVPSPLAVALNDAGDLAYGLFFRDNALNIACTSTKSGEVLWETYVGQSLIIHDHNLDFYIEMRVILNKYIVIAGANGFFAPGHVSVYSCTNGDPVWHHSFQPARVVHISKDFIVTRSRYPKGNLRLLFEVYNFMLPKEQGGL